MKISKLPQKTLALCLALSSSALALASDLESDFDTLGGNQSILDKAKALNPEITTSVVQPRMVPRRNRVELAPELSGSFGGDTYTRTSSVALNVQYHFTPRWSAGLKYNHSFNSLTSEGQSLVSRAEQDFQRNPRDPNARLPNVDYPLNETMAYINWYPMYGKVNLLDRAVAQLDVYAIMGAGQITLRSGPTGSYTGGFGVAFWLKQNLSTRLEVRYQRYSAQYDVGSLPLDTAVAGLQVGWLL